MWLRLTLNSRLLIDAPVTSKGDAESRHRVPSFQPRATVAGIAKVAR